MTRNAFALTSVIVSVFALCCCGTSQAAMLGAYDFENLSGMASVDSDLNSTAGQITPGAGLAINANVSRGETNVAPFVAGTNAQSLAFSQANAATGSAAIARAAEDYFSFTITADYGYQLNLDNLTFRNAMGNLSVNRNWSLDYSINGGAFVTDYDGASFAGPLTTPASTVVWNANTVDFSDPEFDAISSITVRLVQFGNFDSTHAVFYDKIALNGSSFLAPVPEPSSLLMIALGTLFVSRLRRKRANVVCQA